MKQRVVTSRKAAKRVRRKSVKSRRSTTAASKRSFKLAELQKQLSEARQQQRASSEVLKIISSSQGELQPVFQAILKHAIRICEAKFGHMVLMNGDRFHVAAEADIPEQLAEFFRQRGPFEPTPGSHLDRVKRTKRVSHTADDSAEAVQGMASRYGGARSIVAVPMLKNDALIGAILIYRQEVRPFADEQIALLQTFADQAVIAIENTRLFNETQEALERQTATAGILRVIASSPSNLQPVFEAIVARSIQLVGGHSAAVSMFVGDRVELGAMTPVNPEADAALKALFPRRLADYPLFELARSGEVTQVFDIETESRVPRAVKATARARGYRSLLVMPMNSDKGPIGVITVTRKEPGTFAAHHIELMQTFADQAVIAIKNTRLFDEVQAKTRDLEEALVHQTGSANILSVIASSPTDVKPVLNAIVESACELCGANDAFVALKDGESLVFQAQHGSIPVPYERQPIDRQWVTGRAVVDCKPVHVHDIFASEGEEFPRGRELSRRDNTRTVLVVPLLREGESIGAIVLRRLEVHPFSDKQIALLQTFADQAVIAIENVRLFDEVQTKTRDLEEALVHQTGSANILKVIATSPTDIAPVLQAIVEGACELCNAADAAVTLREGDHLRFRAHHGSIPVLADPRPINRTWVNGRAVIDKATVHVHDIFSEDGDEFPQGREMASRINVRTILSVPLLRKNEAIGTIMLRRIEAHPFSDKQVALLRTFADQAVIAIENVRLFDEVRAKSHDLEESLQQQTATADVLKVISRSTFDLRTVLQTLVESAARLCNADAAVITRQQDGTFFRAEAYGLSDEAIKYVRTIPVAADRGSAIGRALLEGAAVHIPDVLADPEYSYMQARRIADLRSVLAVPMLREGAPIGVIAMTRKEARPFTEKQIELAKTFADQAAIAIGNVQLFDAVQLRTRELAQSLEDLRSTQDRLIQTEKLASLGQLTAGIAHEIKNPLNFVNNFSALSVELTDELNEALKQAMLTDKIRKEVDELTGLLKDNLGKVVQHGKRADSIIKNMLLHSREGAGEHRMAEINAIVDESLNLAWHGARAEKHSFEIALERSFDPAAGEIDLFPQDITRALLNLISNGFYAATRRKAEANAGEYIPTLTATTKNLGDRVEIRIRDNGTGIPPEVKEKMFNPFFTTKPAGEGTGLGLSISHDIIVKRHGGSIEVDSRPGEFTEIRVILPRVAALLSERS